ncbi:MAG: hypothetical protein IJF38_04860 [Clostridia bacterium]|nr:hypothetical protein [Clostridia bacterium]
MDALLVYALIFAVVGAAAVVIGVVRKYKKGLTSPIYPLEHYTKLNLTHREDIFLSRHVTRVKVSSSSDKKK